MLFSKPAELNMNPIILLKDINSRVKIKNSTNSTTVDIRHEISGKKAIFFLCFSFLYIYSK